MFAFVLLFFLFSDLDSEWVWSTSMIEVDMGAVPEWI